MQNLEFCGELFVGLHYCHCNLQISLELKRGVGFSQSFAKKEMSVEIGERNSLVSFRRSQLFHVEQFEICDPEAGFPRKGVANVPRGTFWEIWSGSKLFHVEQFSEWGLFAVELLLGAFNG